MWKTPLSRIDNLASHEIILKSDNHLSICLEDISKNKKWLVLFKHCVAFRFKKYFRLKRLGNTFKVADSSWVAMLKRAPMLIPGELDKVDHFLFDTLSGEIEVLSLKEP